MFHNLIRIVRGFRRQLERLRADGISFKGWDKSKALVPFKLFLHPFATFSDMKYEKRSSLMLANAIMLLYFLLRVVGATSTAYLFSEYTPAQVNIFLIFAQTVGVPLLWTVCNWASCTLFNGEGTAREIWISAAYSFIPFLVLEPWGIAASHILSSDEAMILAAVQAVAGGWVLVLVFLGSLTVQQFTVTKTLLLSGATILVMLALCFLFLLFFSITQQLAGFISNIILELSYR